MARPKIAIDPNRVFELASLGCRNTEIATLLDVSADTIERNFAGELAKGRQTLKMNLRAWQIKAAKDGNVAMMIWLGKQLLEQVDSWVILMNKVPDDVLMEEVQRRLHKIEEEKRLLDGPKTD